MEVLNPQDAVRVLEAALLCSHQPMAVRDMRQLFEPMASADDVRGWLAELSSQWVGRGVELRELATGWRFQTCADVQEHLDRLNPEKPPKYSRATMETLAIIAYKQPVTRGDIEDIRGVTVSSQIVKQLEDRGWVEVIGHRDAPGRPGLYATTKHFLDDMGLSSLQQLPTLDSLPIGPDLLPGLADLAASGSEIEPEESDVGDDVDQQSLALEPVDEAEQADLDLVAQAEVISDSMGDGDVPASLTQDAAAPEESQADSANPPTAHEL